MAKSKRLVTRRELLRIIGTFVALVGVCSVLLAGLAIPVVGAVGMASQASTEAFDEMPAELEIVAPSEQSIMYAADGSEIARFYAENRVLVPLDQMSPWIQKAIVAIEDRRFYEHAGIDVEGLARATVNNLIGKDLQGASTLTQQYVKNLLIEQGIQAGDPVAIYRAREASLARKLKEAKYAIELEKKLSKDQILQGYLNIATFGSSVYGVETASRHYFSKAAKDLTVAEAALLAGAVQSPANFDPTKHPQQAQGRRDQVLFAMLNQKVITPAQYEEAKAINVADMLNVTPNYQGCATAGSAAYFCSWVVAEMYRSPQFGKTLKERRAKLLRGGLKVYTTLNPAYQKAAEEAVLNNIPKNDPSNVKLALASVRPGTGEILAIAQNTTFGQATEADPSATENSFTADRDHGGGLGFQTGSTFKPFTLVAWYEANHSGYDLVGGKLTYKANEFNSTCPEQAIPADWTLKNNDNLDPRRRTVIQSTEWSLNSGFAGMASEVDLCAIMKAADKAGANWGAEPPAEAKGFYPASILGTRSVPPLSMANAYATWAAGGKHCSLVALTKVTDRTGAEIEVPKTKCEQVMDEKVAYQVLKTLNASYNFYGGNARIGRPASAKSGTTQNAENAWLVGTTPQISTAVWAGHSEGSQPMLDITVNGRYYSVFYGSGVPSRTWRDYMRVAHADLPVERFPDVSLGTPRRQPTPEPEPGAAITLNPGDPIPEGYEVVGTVEPGADQH